MAEAAVEDRPPQRFYCHVCNVQFQNVTANYTCPHCSDGFIEELQDTPENNEEMVDVSGEWEDSDMDRMMLPLHLMEERRSRTRSEGNRPGRRYANRARIVRPRTLTRLAASNLRQRVPFDNILQDFIVNLGVGVNWGSPGNMRLFLGSPGDYAWGREGLDAIVTQLLNQMDSTGPPPLSKDVIDSLPTAEVSEEQVGAKLQCSVCWEDFELRETVRRLPCTHVYHEPCIRPWLELHGTCPICRQNLGGRGGDPAGGAGGSGGGGGSDGNHDSGGSSGTSTYSMLRNLFHGQQSSSSSSSSNSSTADGNGPTTRSRSHSDSAM